MTARPDWRNPKRLRTTWPIDIWPFSTRVPARETRKSSINVWEIEPSGYVQPGELRATETRSGVDAEFDQQKAAFNEIPPLVLMPYNGLFVASFNGEIVDSDPNLPSLTNRFFSQYGDVPVYITRVGGRKRVLFRTPHRR